MQDATEVEAPERVAGQAESQQPGGGAEHAPPSRQWLADVTVPRTNLIAWAILLLPVVVITLGFFPGHMNIDMLEQIDEVANGPLTNHHSSLLQALWTPLWDLGFGPGSVLIAQLLAFVAGAYLVLRAAFPPIPAAVVTALIALSPQLFGNLGTLIRDTWFLALLVLTFGLVVRAAQRPWPARGRWLALAVAAAWLTLAARQNAAAAVVLACVAIAGLVLARRRESAPAAAQPAGGPGRIRPLLASVAGGIALTLALMGTQVGAAAVLGVRDVHPEAHLFIYDLAAISERQDENLFPPDVMPRRGMAPIERNFSIDTMVYLVFFEPSPIHYPFTSADADSIRDTWWEAVRENPGDYLDARTDLWLRQVGVGADATGVYQPRIDFNAYAIRFPTLNGIATDYQEAFLNVGGPPFYVVSGSGPLFEVWIYLLVALVGAVLLLRRGRSWPLLAVGALGLSALTYQFGLFLGSMGNAYRLEYPCVAAAMLVGAVLLRLGWERWRERPVPAGP